MALCLRHVAVGPVAVTAAGFTVTTTGGLTIAAFPASWLRAWARSIGGNHTLPSSADEALVSGDAVACLDSVMFTICDDPAGTTESARYAVSQCASPNYGLHDPETGLSIDAGSPDEGVTIAVVNGVASAYGGATMPDGATFAAQLYPPLVRNGVVVASNTGDNATAEWRAALCILNDGRCAFAVAAKDMVSFATALLAAGATECGYSDGGGSARLAVAGGPVYGASENRRVAAWFLARPPTAPGDGSAALAVVGMTALATGAYRYFTGTWPWSKLRGSW